MAEITPKESLRLFCVECLSSFFVFDQLDSIEKARAANVTNDREVAKGIFEGSSEDWLVATDVPQDVFSFEDLNIFERHCRTDRVATEGVAVEKHLATLVEGVVDAVGDQHGSKG